MIARLAFFTQLVTTVSANAQSYSDGVMCSGSICMQYIVVDDYDQPISYDSAKYSPAEFGYSGYGDLALQHYFEMNLRYPETAITDKVSGIVYISFVVNSHGDVVRVKLERGVREDIDTESLKAVARMSTWDAARLDGIPVSTKFIIPLSFKFDSEDQHQWRR